MNQPSIFSSMLGLAHPWQITQVEISTDRPRIDIFITCRQSLTMQCPSCGIDAKICGMAEQSWHHSDFFNKEAYLHVTVPVLHCHESCGCIKTNGPWASPGSRFILRSDSLPAVCSTCANSVSLQQLS